MKRAFLAYLVVGIAGTSLLAPSHVAAQAASGEAADKAAKEALIYCLLPKAQYGQLSSYDSGKSAMRLLKQHCPAEFFAFLTSCEKAAGQSTDNCIRIALITAQAALKSFGK